MKKAIVYLAFIVLIPFQLSAQGCLPEGIIFTSQEEIDLFPQTYGSCHTIEGFLTIQGEDITNVDSLYSIRNIDSTLRIQSCPNLTSLLGFSNLENVKDLNISFNNTLTSLSGIDKITSILGGVSIEDNEILAEISDFNKLETLGSLLIINNGSLLKINGFKNLESIENNFFIRNCAKIIDFEAFDELESVGGEFEFIFNSDLSYCPEFKRLTSIGGDFSFIRNKEIKNLIGFTSLSNIGGDVYFNNNINLITLDGLNNLEVIGQDLNIKYNTALYSFDGLNKLNSIGGDFDIFYNDILNSLEGINYLDSIGGELIIYSNPELASLEALINLHFLGSGLVIIDNDGLYTLLGLNNVTSVGDGRLYVNENDVLNTLQGINNVDYKSIGMLQIINNVNLFNCEVESICNWVNDYTGVSYIMNNAYGCNDVPEIRRACRNIGEDIHSFPLLIDHPIWNVLECDQNAPLHCHTVSYEYIKDTVLCWLPSSIIDIDGQRAYIRADGKKTYLRTNTVCWEEEHLLYDFGLNVGETVTVGWNYFQSDKTNHKTTLSVTEKKIVNYLGKDRLRLKLTYNNNASYMYWVEGIGSLTHPFYPYKDLSIEGENHFELLCSDSIWTPQYQNPEWNVCDTIVDGFPEHLATDGLVISPNPFINTIRISSITNKIKNLQIYALTGQIIPFKMTIERESILLKVDEQLPNGIYLIHILTEKGRVNKRIIKTDRINY